MPRIMYGYPMPERITTSFLPPILIGSPVSTTVCVHCGYFYSEHRTEGGRLCGDNNYSRAPSVIIRRWRTLGRAIFININITQLLYYSGNGFWAPVANIDQARQVDPLFIPEAEWESAVCDYCGHKWALHDGGACDLTVVPTVVPRVIQAVPRPQVVRQEDETGEGPTPREIPSTLLSQRKFGVEIELIRLNKSSFKEKMRKYNINYEDGEGWADNTKWVLKSDGSVGGDGLELVSPPLKGPDGLAELKLVLGLINSCNGRVDETCGLHVHHDVRNLNEAQLKRLLSLYKKYEKLLYLIASPERFQSSYCKPRTMTQFNTIMSASSFRTATRQDRYQGLNFCSIDRHGTVEFRLLEGTTNEKKIEAWVILTQRLVFKARNGGRVVYNTVTGLRSVDNIDLMGRTLGLKRSEQESHSFLILKECYNKHKNTADGRRILRHV